MNLTVNGIKPRAEGDPDYADYWLELIHLDCAISWEVPLSKEQLESIRNYLPKWVRDQIEVKNEAIKSHRKPEKGEERLRDDTK